jgi:hypothetical protein
MSDPSKLKDNSAKSSPKDADPDGASSVTSRHSRGKKSTDPTERLSLFGTIFPTQLGKSRKPPPKYQAYALLFSEEMTS